MFFVKLEDLQCLAFIVVEITMVQLFIFFNSKNYKNVEMNENCKSNRQRF